MCVERLNRRKTCSLGFRLGLAYDVRPLILLQSQQGGAEHSGDCTQRSYPLVLEAESDQLCVPALFF